MDAEDGHGRYAHGVGELGFYGGFNPLGLVCVGGLGDDRAHRLMTRRGVGKKGSQPVEEVHFSTFQFPLGGAMGKEDRVADNLVEQSGDPKIADDVDFLCVNARLGLQAKKMRHALDEQSQLKGGETLGPKRCGGFGRGDRGSSDGRSWGDGVGCRKKDVGIGAGGVDRRD